MKWFDKIEFTFGMDPSGCSGKMNGKLAKGVASRILNVCLVMYETFHLS